MQLLFTTHESSIMDQAIFRRDEIWFVERNAENASSIYSLDHFKERYDKVLRKAYLEGRYGAIPVFSTFDFARQYFCTERGGVALASVRSYMNWNSRTTDEEEQIEPNAEQIIKNEKDGHQTFIYKLLLARTGINPKKNSAIGELAKNIEIAIEQEKKINEDIHQCKGQITCNKYKSHLLGSAKEIISVDVYGDTQEIIEDCLDVLEPFIEEVIPKERKDQYYDYSEVIEIDLILKEYFHAA